MCELSELFHKIDDQQTKRADFDRAVEVIHLAIRALADENVGVQSEVMTYSNFIDKYIPIRF